MSRTTTPASTGMLSKSRPPWRHEPEQLRLQVVENTKTTCSTSHTINVWKYRPLPLVLSYTCAVGATVLALCIGGQALLSNGVSRDKSFSPIVRTTRNRDLDELSPSPESAGLPLACLWPASGLPLAEGLGSIRLRVGKVETDLSEKIGQATGRRVEFYANKQAELHT